MPAQQTEWTAEMVRALPEDGNRYEVLDGELFVSPAPRPDHQAVVFRLAVILDRYVRQHKLGWVFTSPADLEFSPRRQVQPDVFVVADTGKGRPRSWREARPITLVAEVKSESTARADRITKRSIYQSERIPEWHPKEDGPPLEINLPEFFAAALD